MLAQREDCHMDLATAEALARDIEGWLNLAEGHLLYKLARSVTGRGAIVEVGSHMGKSTTWLACGSLSGKGSTVYAVDPWDGSGEAPEAFLHNIRAACIDKLVSPIPMSSEKAAASFDQPVELIFIDGDHSYEAVRLDLELWLRKVVEGGVLAFHDSIQFPGVARMLEAHVFPSNQFADARLSRSITIVRKVERQGVIGGLRMRLGARSFQRKRARLARRLATGRRLHRGRDAK
jgi:predicted O-methyltransferase YrrM